MTFMLMRKLKTTFETLRSDFFRGIARGIKRVRNSAAWPVKTVLELAKNTSRANVVFSVAGSSRKSCSILLALGQVSVYNSGATGAFLPIGNAFSGLLYSQIHRFSMRSLRMRGSGWFFLLSEESVDVHGTFSLVHKDKP